MAQNESPPHNHPYSHHIFLFPFRWDYNTRKRSELQPQPSLFTKRTSLGNIEKLFAEHNHYAEGRAVFEPHRYWKRFYFNINRGRDFNEYTYFEESVREVIFDREGAEPDKRVLLQYDYQYDKATYQITVHDPANRETQEKKYSLSVTDIVANFYQSGVGIISFHLDNFEYGELADILLINESGRRIYPPFLGDNCDSSTKATQAPQEAGMLAKSITLQLDNMALTENFEFYNRGWDQVQKNPERLPKFIHALLGSHFTSFDTGADKHESYVVIKPIIDDRMFVICWYCNGQFSRRLSGWSHPSASDSRYHYETDPNWLSYTFIDPSPGDSLANKRLLSELNRKHTYDRWVEYGTLYGVTRYSFVALTGPGFGVKQVLPQMQTMYFQMVMLALIQRASLLRFAQEATNLASLQLDSGNQLGDNARGLYEKYLTFTNKMYFRAVTAQEQGIELYRLLTESIGLDKEVEVTQKEIDELNRYATLKAENDSKKRLSLLTLLVSAFSIPSFLLSYYGMDFVKQAGGDSSADSQIERFLEEEKTWPFLLGLFMLFVLNALFFSKDFMSIWRDDDDPFQKKGWIERHKSKVILIVVVIVIALALIAPWFYH